MNYEYIIMYIGTYKILTFKHDFTKQGRLCELDVDECVRFANTDLGCQNGAECKNTAGSYECMCAPNWYGLHCTKRKNDCNSASSAEFCGHGICINQLTAIGGYTCICHQVSVHDWII